ncbi:hypothetical protein [Bartonella sp. HY406]|uniref:hypothetical protein n=1 Tax=Bartonella sp. HY406 TaxID=2979331 RepID=UPI0021C94D47|nr:hypothetical protein [Bartonella sp. HY406]UXN03914.1 hypothetical protein N6B01_02425 [Bartonella sp. HY406]
MQQVFYPLDLSPPSAESCMHAVKQAFSQYAPYRERHDFCDSCIAEEVFPEFQNAIDHPNTAKPWVYELFFHEHIDCVGTINNLKFWLPRTLETSILDSNKHFTFEVFEKYKSQNIGFWSPHETKALRQVFTRSLIGVVEHMDAAPLGPQLPDFASNDYDKAWPTNFALQAIIGSLIALRVNPQDIFAYVFKHCDERIDYFLAHIIIVEMEPWWLGDLDKGLPNNLTDYDKVNIFLDQNAMQAVLNHVSKDYLAQQLAKYQTARNQLLVQNFELAIGYYDERKKRPQLISQQNGEEAILKLIQQGQFSIPA